jgi:hypothetical protein
MSINGGKQASAIRTTGMTAVVLVAAGILLMLLGPLTEYGTSVLGGVVLAAGVACGLFAVIANQVRR